MGLRLKFNLVVLAVFALGLVITGSVIILAVFLDELKKRHG